MEKPAYRDKFQLLNKSELALYNRLNEAAPALITFSQVSMSQIFWISRFQKGSFAQLGEIGRKSVDFLLCRKDNTSIVLAIELNGPTHEKEERKKSDETKRAALEQAGIPLVTFTPEAIPETQELRKILAPYIVERRQYEEKRDERKQPKTSL